MLSLPQDVILEICSYIDLVYIHDDFEDELTESEKQILIEYGYGEYFSVKFLHDTCKSFSWLSTLEYIHIDHGEFYDDIVSKNINGVRHGMYYNLFDKTIIGYACYDHNKMIQENLFYTDSHYHYRSVNGIHYLEDDSCTRFNDVCECKTCLQLNTIQQSIFKQDFMIKNIINKNYNNGKIIIRPALRENMRFDFNTDHIVIV